MKSAFIPIIIIKQDPTLAKSMSMHLKM